MTLADGAAEAGALALASGGRRRSAARARCRVGGGRRRGLGARGRVTVRLRPPSPLPALRRSARGDQLGQREARRAMSGRVDPRHRGRRGRGLAGGRRGARLRRRRAGSTWPAGRRRRPGAAPDPARLGGARELEERLAAHLPRAARGPRGRSATWRSPATPEGLERVPAALPLVRGALAVLHLPPGRCQDAAAAIRASDPAASCCGPTSPPTGRCWPWSSAICASATSRVASSSSGSAGSPAPRPVRRPAADAAGGLPLRLRRTLLESEISAAHQCYAEPDGAETHPAGAAQPERRDHAGAGSR